jgi:hypothetical protein
MESTNMVTIHSFSYLFLATYGKDLDDFEKYGVKAKKLDSDFDEEERFSYMDDEL